MDLNLGWEIKTTMCMPGIDIAKSDFHPKDTAPIILAKPFVKTNKNDAINAQAIVEAATRPAMNSVAIKQLEQHDIQSVHRLPTRSVCMAIS